MINLKYIKNYLSKKRNSQLCIGHAGVSLENRTSASFIQVKPFKNDPIAEFCETGLSFQRIDAKASFVFSFCQHYSNEHFPSCRPGSGWPHSISARND